MKDSALKKWIYRNDVKILETNRRVYKSAPPSFDFFSRDDMYIPPEVVIENAYVIEIPESKLEEIVNFERRVFGNRPNYDDHYYDLFHDILEKQEFESQIREKHPAVKNAFEQYKTLLELAKSGNL